jgi:outer membrane protein assembly factor BamD
MEKSIQARFLALFVLVAASGIFLPGCILLRRHPNPNSITQVNPGDQPDKILYEKATHEIARGHYDVGRLTLQTLINTYPDSEFLAKAKLSIADSYYQEGGVSGYTQAEAEYKDFITFFPTAPEAPEAQYRVGMSHFRLMAKADRDRTEAKLAEAELKEFLLRYPDSPLMPRVKARLREAQEVLGEGEYRIAYLYYLRGANLAAQSRFRDVVDNYPNFSRGDSALYYLGQTLERLKVPQMAAPYYSRIITDFPFSPYVNTAKTKLTALHQPIPRPTRAMLARAQADAARRHHQDLLQRMTSMMSSSPDVSATLQGPVHLGTPPPGGVEAAKTAPGAAAPAGATIVAQPVGDASLNAGKPVDSKSGATTPPQNNAPGAATPEKKAEDSKPSPPTPPQNTSSMTQASPRTPNPSDAATAEKKAEDSKSASTSPTDKNGSQAQGTAPASNSSEAAPPAKKKGRFHILKKLLPF